MKRFFLWEVSFECGNKVGGIWTVITSKAAEVAKKFNADYTAIGFFNPEKSEIIEEVPPKWLLKVLRNMKKNHSLQFRYGKWVDANDVNLLLVDAREFQQKNINDIKAKMWEWYGIDSMNAGHDYDEPLAWSYAVGLLLEEIAKYTVGIDVVQCHEWLAGGTLLYLRHQNAHLPLVFTTHATVLGRAIGGATPGDNPEVLAAQHNVKAKHMLECAAARVADAFTTVSELTGEEATSILDKAPDVITRNAMDGQSLPPLSEMLKLKVQAREKIDEFVKAYFLPYYPLDLGDYPILYTAGRYEFQNKGYDLLIDALGKVNHSLKSQQSDKWLLALLLVPAGTLGIKEEVIQNFMSYSRMKDSLKEEWEGLSDTIYGAGDNQQILKEKMDSLLHSSKEFVSKLSRFKGKTPPLCAFRLAIPEEEDPILQKLKQNGLLNRQEDRVKVVFYPVFITRRDELIGMKFKEIITAASLGGFLSRYEPWGYTPMEAAAHVSVALTTEHAGFGRSVATLGDQVKGISVLKNEDLVNQTARTIETFSKMDKDERLTYETSAYKIICDNYLWKDAIKSYFRAYDIALKRMARRVGSDSSSESASSLPVQA